MAKPIEMTYLRLPGEAAFHLVALEMLQMEDGRITEIIFGTFRSSQAKEAVLDWVRPLEERTGYDYAGKNQHDRR